MRIEGSSSTWTCSLRIAASRQGFFSGCGCAPEATKGSQIPPIGSLFSLVVRSQPPAPVAPPPAPQVPPAGAPRPYSAPFSPSQPQAFPAQAPVFRPPGFTPPPSAPLAPAFFMGSQTVAPAPPASQPESPAYNIPAPGPPPVAPSRLASLPPQASRVVAQPPQQPSAPHRYNSVISPGHTPGSGLLIGGPLSSTAGRQPLPRFPQQVEGGKNGRSRGLTPQTAGVFRPGPAGSELGAPGAQEAHKYYYPPRMPLPLPTCFHNPTGYPCCNPALNDLMVETYTELEARPKFHTCNINAIATALQNKAQEKFNTSFETIAAFDDFAQKIHFNGDLVCKVELGGK
ncbi:CRE-GRD-9 protein [Aphelenchoides avenae]|nr:CRE-GRD-9 protein [Aphelenchus avenae]